jgi:nitrate reductase alpha subunit
MKIALKQFVTMFLAIGLLFAPALQAQQQSQTAKPQNVPVPVQGNGPAPPSPSPPSISYNGSLSVPSGVSLAVAQTEQSAMVNLSNKVNANTAASSDYASAATATQAMLGNFNETGFTAAVQAFIVNNETLFTTNPTTAQLTYAYNQAKAAGSSLTLAQFENALLSSTLAERQALYTAAQQGQLQAALNDMVTQLQGLSASLRRGSNGGHYILAGCGLGFGIRSLGIYLAVVGLVVATGGAGAVALGTAIGIAGVGGSVVGEILGC